MGLLSDTTLLPKLKKLAIDKSLKLSVLLYFGSILVAIALCHNQFNNGNYFSENALLAGIATPHYDRHYAKKAYDLNHDLYQISEPYQFKPNRTYLENLEAFLVEKKFQVTIENDSVIAILKSKRATNFESFVLHVPFTLFDYDEKFNFGIGSLLSLADMFSQKKFWSKNLVVGNHGLVSKKNILNMPKNKKNTKFS